MDRVALPPVTFGDGLGWNSEFLWMCSSDECPIFRKGFEQAFEMYGRTVSMRAIVEPDTGRHSVMPAATFDPGHIKTFLDARANHTRSLRDENLDDEEMPDADDFEPGKGFGQ
ncbi:MAG: hypothetical protein HQK86_13220 [Nitrospinae bacterium]|nr:hypothetical protein [Nitrospinota bacterium]